MQFLQIRDVYYYNIKARQPHRLVNQIDRQPSVPGRVSSVSSFMLSMNME